MPRGRNQMSYYGQCPENEMAHMQRPPGPCFDNYPKMDGHCGMGVSEFKSPMMNADPTPPPAKKKRRASNNMSAAAQQSPTIMPDLCPPPPLSGYGDTIVASNPFDDTPSMPLMSHMNPMNHVNKHMSVGPCMSPAGPPMMGSMSPCHIVGSPMQCGPPVGSPINCGPPMGNCSPMSGAGNNANCVPVGSPLTGCNSRQISRSPLVGTPMNANSVMSNSSMNSVMPMNRSPSSMGSPLSSVMGSNVRGNSPLDCGLNINSVGSQKGSPMSVMNSHNINNLNCGSPMGSPSNVPLNNCNSSMMGSPIPSPLSNVPCGLSSGAGNSDLGINLNTVMNRSPHNAPPPNAVNASMMCNPAMRGPSPISTMSMNCNSNPSMMNQKPDMNMSDLVVRDGCGPGHLPMKPNNGPSGGCGILVNHISSARPSDLAAMQCGPMNTPHCGPMMNNQCLPNIGHGPCIGGGMNRAPCPPGMGMNISFDSMNPQFRPAMNRSQFPRGMASMAYGPQSMNGPPMNGPINGAMNGPMNSHMNGPMNGPMNSSLNGPMNSPMNGPMNSLMNGPMNSPMNGPMNSPMNGPMNSPMNGPMNSPINGPMNNPLNGPLMNSPMHNLINGPNMGNMCGPSELNSLSGCSPNNSTGLHCIGDQGPPTLPMNSVQCMNPNGMNQCPPPQPPNSMFNSPYNQFETNNARCSPSMNNFHPNDMNMNNNNNFYRAPSVNNGNSAPCMPNMHPSVAATTASDVLGVTDAIASNSNISKNDPSTVDSDIASVVCGITNDATDELNLLGDELLRDTKPDEQQQRKSIKEFGDSHLLLGDEVVAAVKDEELESKPNKTELDAKVGGEEMKRDAVAERKDSSTPVPSATTAAITCTTSNVSSSTAACVTTSGSESPLTTLESADVNSGGNGSALTVKSGDGANEDDAFASKSGNGSGTGDLLINASAASENESSAMEDSAADIKVKNEPMEEKLLEGDFHEDDDSGHQFHKILSDDKSEVNSNAGEGSGNSAATSGEDSGSAAAAAAVQGGEKEMGKVTVPTPGMVKMEGEELFDGSMCGPGGQRRKECPTPGSGIRPGGNGFTGPPSMLPTGAPPVSFNIPHPNDMASTGMMPNAASCMNDALCNNPMLPNMGRPSLPHNANHATNFPNRNVCKVYPINKSKVYNSQNPNAPPIYACGKCHKEINDNDQAILCESGCHFWYHRSCSGLTEMAYQFLTSEIYAEWACDSCLNTKNIPLVKYKP